MDRVARPLAQWAVDQRTGQCRSCSEPSRAYARSGGDADPPMLGIPIEFKRDAQGNLTVVLGEGVMEYVFTPED